jgi:predicted DNA-binding ribbon-helix-helix protein
MNLDEPTWRALLDIADREGFTVNEFCIVIHAEKPRAVRFTDAVRFGILRYYRDAATESDH